MRLGAYVAQLAEGSQVAQAYGSTVVSERHRHRYEFNPRYRARFDESDFWCSGTSPDGRLVEFIELRSHPFWVGTQAHPELKSRPTRPAPLFRELDRRRPWPAPRAARRTCSTSTPTRPAPRSARDRRASPSSARSSWCAARCSASVRSHFPTPDGERVRARRSSTTPARWRSCRCTTTARSRLVRQYRAALEARPARAPGRHPRRGRRARSGHRRPRAGRGGRPGGRPARAPDHLPQRARASPTRRSRCSSPATSTRCPRPPEREEHAMTVERIPLDEPSR